VHSLLRAVNGTAESVLSFCTLLAEADLFINLSFRRQDGTYMQPSTSLDGFLLQNIFIAQSASSILAALAI
jgi:hypothetical protein